MRARGRSLSRAKTRDARQRRTALSTESGHRFVWETGKQADFIHACLSPVCLRHCDIVCCHSFVRSSVIRYVVYINWHIVAAINIISVVRSVTSTLYCRGRTLGETAGLLQANSTCWNNRWLLSYIHSSNCNHYKINCWRFGNCCCLYFKSIHSIQVNVPTLTPARSTSTQFTYLWVMEGWVDLGGWLHTEMVHLSTDRHPSK